MRLKKTKVLTKGVESATVVAVAMALAKLLDIDVDEKIITAAIIGAVGIYHALKNWWKHR